MVTQRVERVFLHGILLCVKNVAEGQNKSRWTQVTVHTRGLEQRDS